MINADDLKYHIPNDADHRWAETGYFNIYVPEKNLLVWLYYVHRAGIGVTNSNVEIINRWSPSIDHSVYIDHSNYNPLPTDPTRFTLPSGLSFEARSLSSYRVGYDAGGVKLDIDFDAIMPPYDIHDPSMDPMAVTDTAEAIANSGFGSAYASHFDMSVRAKGTLQIGDERHAVDCVSTMDHSWGMRPENDFQPMTWTNAHFSENYVLHAIFYFHKNKPVGQQHDFKHGYALINGKVRGLKAGLVRTLRAGLYPTHVEMQLTDIDDRIHIVRGPMVAHVPWRIYGNNMSPMAMAELRSPDIDGSGVGTYFEGWPLNRING